MKNFKTFKSFTLAEVLITLTIIGVIAALTIPNLMRNYRKQQRISEIKAAYSIIQNAVRLSVAENGDVRNWDYNQSTEFATKYIMPYLKIQKKCGRGPAVDSVGLINKDCFTENQTTWYGLDGATFMDWGGYDSRWYYKVILENGMHLAIWAADKQNQYPNKSYDIHVNYPKFVVDVNGGRGKTTAGIDVFMFYLDLKNGAVKGMIPYGLYTCSKSSSRAAGLGCAGLIQNNSWTFPEDYPVKDF